MDGEEGEVSSPDTSHHHQPSCQLFWCHWHCQLGPLGTSVINLVQWVVIPTLDLLVRSSPQVIVQRSVHRKLGPAALWLTASAPAKAHSVASHCHISPGCMVLATLLQLQVPWAAAIVSSVPCLSLASHWRQADCCCPCRPDGWQCCAVVPGPPGL